MTLFLSFLNLFSEANVQSSFLFLSVETEALHLLDSGPSVVKNRSGKEYMW